MKIKLLTYNGIDLGEIPYIPGYGDQVHLESFPEIDYQSNYNDIMHNHVIKIVHDFQKKEIRVFLGKKPQLKLGGTRTVVKHSSSGGDDGFIDGMIVGGLFF